MRLSDLSFSLIGSVVNFLYPAACPSCSSPTDNLTIAPFCTACWKSMERYAGPSCSICGIPLSSSYADRCRSCLKNPPAFIRASFFGLYDAMLASVVHHYKFLGMRRLSKPLADLLMFYDTTGIDALVSVPLSLRGLKDRGFNQALLLAAALSREKRLPLIIDVLRKVADTPPQVGLSAKERTANVKKAFVCTGKLSGMNILLIDDVMTTGATVNACSQQLLRSGARSINVLTLARSSLL